MNTQEKDPQEVQLWTKIPCLSTMLPCIGHVGICQSNGTIYDYLGYGIHYGELGFNKPMKFTSLFDDTIDCAKWDKAIVQASEQFSITPHNLLTNNCHHYVARVLNIIKYQGKENWGQYDIWRLALKGEKVNSAVRTSCFKC